jgi:hypothetical protein
LQPNNVWATVPVMSTRADLLAAHKAMATVLDAKFAKNPEWTAFRLIDKALLNLIEIEIPKGRGSLPDPESATARATVAAEAVIRELNRPVPLAELYEKIAARGVVLGGKHPNRRLSAILGDRGTLISTPQGWWIADAEQRAQKEQQQQRQPARRAGMAGTTYPDLAVRALNEANKPLATFDLIQFIREHRTLPDNGRKTVVNITSAFSHDDRLQNTYWLGRRVWWLADRPLPSDPMDTPINGELRLNGVVVPENQLAEVPVKGD